MAERFRSKQHVVKEVVWLIEQEAGAYQVSPSPVNGRLVKCIPTAQLIRSIVPCAAFPYHRPAPSRPDGSHTPPTPRQPPIPPPPHPPQDPITQFLQCLYVRFDFDGAQERLQACYHVLRNDYFLSGCAFLHLVSLVVVVVRRKGCVDRERESRMLIWYYH